MTFAEWLTLHPKTLQKLAQALTDITASYGEDPIYPHRLQRLMSGIVKPGGYEVKAVLELTEDEVDSYNETQS